LKEHFVPLGKLVALFRDIQEKAKPPVTWERKVAGIVIDMAGSPCKSGVPGFGFWVIKVIRKFESGKVSRAVFSNKFGKLRC
jgi:hypothetical protein